MMIRKNLFLSKDEDANVKETSEFITLSDTKRIESFYSNAYYSPKTRRFLPKNIKLPSIKFPKINVPTTNENSVINKRFDQ